uniref:Uncharacterized protein n=1 Tax=Chloropicon roscoffensis TaxID=1461544 RepID=A0A7S3FNY9_9CHLO
MRLTSEHGDRGGESTIDVGHHAEDVPRWPCEAGSALSLLTSGHLSNKVLFVVASSICNWSGIYEEEGILIRVGLEPWNEDVKGGAVDAEGLEAREVCQHPRV